MTSTTLARAVNDIRAGRSDESRPGLLGRSKPKLKRIEGRPRLGEHERPEAKLAFQACSMSSWLHSQARSEMRYAANASSRQALYISMHQKRRLKSRVGENSRVPAYLHRWTGFLRGAASIVRGHRAATVLIERREVVLEILADAAAIVFHLGTGTRMLMVRPRGRGVRIHELECNKSKIRVHVRARGAHRARLKALAPRCMSSSKCSSNSFAAALQIALPVRSQLFKLRAKD